MPSDNGALLHDGGQIRPFKRVTIGYLPFTVGCLPAFGHTPIMCCF